MQAVLLSVGDELVLGQTVDTNTAWVAERLARRAVRCVRHETVEDDRARIADALRRAAADAPLVIVTGGLGPTADDLTREALADAMGVALELHEPSLRRLEAFFAERGRPMAERNRVQAMRPVGTETLDNHAGTAPALHARLGEADVYLAPGVPREMRWVFERHIEPVIKQAMGNGATLLATKINTFGLGESDLAERLGELMERDRQPTVGTTVSGGICSVRVRSVHDDADTALRELEETVQEVRQRVGPLIFGRDEQTLQEATAATLREAGLTVATAESCTGGIVGGMLTDVPGSSAVYAGGWVTYSNEMKVRQLAVDAEWLEQHGAVSAAVACAMATNACRNSGADLAVSLTGVAGPGGGTDEKPVGTVWIGLAHRAEANHSQSDNGIETQAFLARLVGPRAAVRDRAAKCALQLLRLRALGEDPALIQWLSPGEDAR